MKSFVVFLLFLEFNVFGLYACKCETPRNINEAYNTTHLIVHGKILEIEYVPLSMFYTNQEIKRIKAKYESKQRRLQSLNLELIKIEFEIKKIYKGNTIQNSITIYTARNRESCGYPFFEKGKEFIGFLSESNYMNFLFKDAKVGAKRENVFWTNQCTLTSLFDTKLDAELTTLSKRSKKAVDTSLLLGQWKAFKKTTLEGTDGSEITLSGEPYTVKLELEFLNDNKVYFNNGEGKIEFDYILNKETLKISHFTFTINKLSEKELVLKEEKLLGGLIYLNKVVRIGQ